MRFRAVIWCFAIASLPQLALAARPPGEVGALQAVYDFCGKVDPTQRATFEQHADSLLRGLTPAQIAALRHTAEYKRGYETLAGILPGVNQPVQACQAISGVRSPPSVGENGAGKKKPRG